MSVSKSKLLTLPVPHKGDEHCDPDHTSQFLTLPGPNSKDSDKPKMVKRKTKIAGMGMGAMRRMSNLGKK